MLKIEAFQESFPLAQAFTISRGTKTHAQVIRVTISEGKFKGHGECVPYARYGETVETVLKQIKTVSADLTIDNLQTELPAGAARNALDCALWDLKAKKTNKPAWERILKEPPLVLTTAYTLSLDTPEAMNAQASKNSDRPLLKLKLGGEQDLQRLEAVRQGAPHSKIIVDANEGWSRETWVT